MKNPLWLLIGIVFYWLCGFSAGIWLCSREYEREYIRITPNAQGGYDVRKRDKLLLEFTKQNTDSASLETLRYIAKTLGEGK